VRARIAAESAAEGQKGLSGRDSIKIFSHFFALYAKEDRLINMSNVLHYFTNVRKDLLAVIPEGFLDALVRLYDYKVLQEIKESLYDFNEEQIGKDIKNYLYALNFEMGAEVVNRFTGDRFEVGEAFLESIERRLLGESVSAERRGAFRQKTQKEYTARTLTQELMVENKTLEQTKLYQSLYERYIYNIKENVLDPLLKNENFRNAIKDYNTEGFRTYDKRIKRDVSFLMDNLVTIFNYSEQGAREICIYTIDKLLKA
jgi:hypothetical protein